MFIAYFTVDSMLLLSALRPKHLVWLYLTFIRLEMKPCYAYRFLSLTFLPKGIFKKCLSVSVYFKMSELIVHELLILMFYGPL